jgi:stearoyl-CoA desaturase (Delta-9 desaturase)
MRTDMIESPDIIEMTELPVANPSAELLFPDEVPERISLAVRLAVLAAIIVPIAGVMAAPLVVWGWGFRWTDFALLLTLYMLTGLGITVGYHRLFVHHSFETNALVKLVLAILGSMAVEGPLFRWVGMHRRHHQHADMAGDPHSPHSHGGGVLGLLRGIWHAHIGWLFDPEPLDLDRYIQDLSRSRMLRVASALFPLWVALGLLIPAILGGLLTRTWAGVWTGLIWGGLVRIFLIHHVTWSVNSACHLWGWRPFRSNDESRNNALFGILALGEGWHNSHHAFPTSARHGLRWWQIDISYWVIWTLARLGLAWDVKLPTRQAQRLRQRLS